MTELEIGTVTSADPRGGIFVHSSAYADQETWHATAKELRDEQPCLLVEAEGFRPFYALTRHEDVFHVSRNNATFLNTRDSVLGPELQFEMLKAMGVDPKTLIHMDGAEHDDHRALANPYFRPTAVAKRQEGIDAIAAEFVQRMKDMGGECDFAQDIAVPYTLRVIMSIYGVPEEDEATMLRLTQGLFGAADPEYLGDFTDPFEMVQGTIKQFEEYFDGITKDRQANPRDDLASLIANGEVNGCPMDHHAQLWYYIIVATAGHDTTSFALSGGMHNLITNPGEMAKLQADPGLLVTAVDEMIRLSSPVRHFMRYPTQAVSFHGVEIPEGSRILLSYPSANRDDRMFEDPMDFKVDRENAPRMISFGGGDHFCLGSTFARRELRTIIPKLMASISSIELAGDPEWSEAAFVGGLKHLPVKASFR